MSKEMSPEDLKRILKDQGFTTKEDLSPILDEVKKLTIKEVLEHAENDCSNDKCGIHTLINNMDQSGFNRGFTKGWNFRKLYPSAEPGF